MAVTRKGNTIRMTAANDEVTGEFKVMDVTLIHTTVATASLGDSADFVHENLAATAELLSPHHVFPKGLMMNGVKAVALSAGTLIIHFA